ncbi:GrpB family protein [Streptomyces sp. 7-21]|jgi:GrpB-like predicted nucleotidyltransferase (UPF0157 family)|uniref:GrpB family protein n=1 Tax=Streptomyces sp. 7-21 TaxID=2802283 RepID=UPI00191D6520|nr:GrpB family protein [Streptomyces sp. 7-21]MBL1066235.1 GrpB family protein [Streptomyces sp. 7-21]
MSGLRRVRRPVIIDACPAWATRGAELCEDLRSALRPLAVRVDHVGGTAVPGMASQDVIDLQVSVRNLDRAAESFDAPLAGLGFTRCPAEPEHAPAGWDGAPAAGRARVWCRRGHPDGDARVSAHLSGSPEERRALLLRDWFRAHPEAVPGYSGYQRALAAAVAGHSGYAEVMAPVTDLLTELAESWAARTGWRP